MNATISKETLIGGCLKRLVGRWRRDQLARAIRKDRRYFQPLGFGRTNRLNWQIRLLLKAPNYVCTLS
jgi:hypothetical protein